jgi:hypothetical protein
MRHAIFLAIVVIGLAAAPAPAQTAWRYKFKDKETLRYLFEQDTITTVSVKDKGAATRLRILWDLEWTVLKVDAEGSAAFSLKIDRARMFLEGGGNKAAADSADKNEPEDDLRKGLANTVKIMAAMELRGTMSANGELKNVMATEASLKTIKALGGADTQEKLLESEFARSMQFAPVFPTGIAKGKQWSKKNETKASIGTTIMERTYTVENPLEKDGRTLERASIKVGIKFQPDEKAKVKTEIKDVKSDGHLWFDNKAGQVFELVVNYRIQSVLESKDASANQTIEQSLTIRLKK